MLKLCGEEHAQMALQDHHVEGTPTFYNPNGHLIRPALARRNDDRDGRCGRRSWIPRTLMRPLRRVMNSALSSTSGCRANHISHRYVRSAVRGTTRSFCPLPRTRTRAPISSLPAGIGSDTRSAATSPTRNPAQHINPNISRSRGWSVPAKSRSTSASLMSRGSGCPSFTRCRRHTTGFVHASSSASSAKNSKK
jgi:hypothetical protein